MCYFCLPPHHSLQIFANISAWINFVHMSICWCAQAYLIRMIHERSTCLLEAAEAFRHGHIYTSTPLVREALIQDSSSASCHPQLRRDTQSWKFKYLLMKHKLRGWTSVLWEIPTGETRSKSQQGQLKCWCFLQGKFKTLSISSSLTDFLSTFPFHFT